MAGVLRKTLLTTVEIKMLHSEGRSSAWRDLYCIHKVVKIWNEGKARISCSNSFIEYPTKNISERFVFPCQKQMFSR